MRTLFRQLHTYIATGKVPATFGPEFREYFEDARALLDAWRAWKVLHRHDTRPVFEFPAGLLDGRVAVLGGLPLLDQFARNEAAVALVAWLDERTAYRCAIGQFLALVAPEIVNLPPSQEN